jgi:hypothetical protein
MMFHSSCHDYNLNIILTSNAFVNGTVTTLQPIRYIHGMNFHAICYYGVFYNFYRTLKVKLLIVQTRVLKEITIMDESENSGKRYLF